MALELFDGAIIHRDGKVYDAVPISKGMSVAHLIFVLSRSLEASGGRATIVGIDGESDATTLAVLVSE